MKRLLLFAASLLLLGPIKTFAAEKLVIGYPTTSSQFAPLWFAKDTGIYEKNGLSPDLVFIRGFNLLQGMMAGQVDVAQSGIAEAVLPIVRGGDIRIIGLTAKIFPYTLITNKEIKTAKDLKGGKIAINRLADVSEVGTRLALRELGLSEKDVTMIQIGGSPQRLAALQSGSVQAAALDFMSGLRLAKRGYHVLVQISPSYPYLGLLATGTVLRERPRVAEAFVRSFVESLTRFKRNREEGTQAIARYMQSTDKEIIDKVYDFISTKFYADNFEPDPKAMRDLLDELAQTDPLARKASVNQLFDLRIIRKLEQEGLFKSLSTK